MVHFMGIIGFVRLKFPLTIYYFYFNLIFLTRANVQLVTSRFSLKDFVQTLRPNVTSPHRSVDISMVMVTHVSASAKVSSVMCRECLHFVPAVSPFLF